MGSALLQTELSSSTEGTDQQHCPSLSLANYISCLSAVAWAVARKGIVTEAIPEDDSLNALAYVILPCQGGQTKWPLGSFSHIL